MPFRRLSSGSIASRVLAACALSAAAAAAGGCGNRKGPGGASPGAGGGAATRPVELVTPRVGDPSVLLRVPGQASSFYLDVYQVAVPIGAVSESSDFWRRVDEERIDPATKDLLLKNGIRSGVAANDDWDYFRELIEQHPHVSRNGSAVATGTGVIELPMRTNVPTQDIFLYRGRNNLVGRTYEQCDDLIGVSFWPDPRRADQMRISLSPTVRSTRTVLEFTRRGEERYFVDRAPEFLYEMNLRVVVPTDRFLVLGLSPLGRWTTSLGYQFLTTDGDVEKKEQVLLFVPRLPTRAQPATQWAVPDIATATTATQPS